MSWMDLSTQTLSTQTIRTSSLIIIDCCSSRNIQVGPSSVYFISSIITPKTQSVPTRAALRFLDTIRMIAWCYIKTIHPHRHFKTWLGLVGSVSNNLMRCFLFVGCWLLCLRCRSFNMCVNDKWYSQYTLPTHIEELYKPGCLRSYFRTFAVIINCAHTFVSSSAYMDVYGATIWRVISVAVICVCQSQVMLPQHL